MAAESYRHLKLVSAAYIKRARELGANNVWILLQRGRPSWYASRLDEIVARMPPTEVAKLTDKFSRIVPENTTAWKDYDDRYRDVLVEILGWGLLAEKYPQCAPTFNETPDLLVVDKEGATVAAMECKKFWESEEERAWWRDHMSKEGKGAIAALGRDPNKNPLLAKLRNVLDRAVQQVDASGPQTEKFVLLAVNLDVETWLQDEAGGVVTDLFGEEEQRLQANKVGLVAFFMGTAKPLTELAGEWRPYLGAP